MVRLIDLGEDLRFGLVVGGADLRGSFEGHVLEHVGETGDPRHLLRRPDVDIGVEGNHRSSGPLDDQKSQAVREPVLRESLLERLELLGAESQRQKQEHRGEDEGSKARGLGGLGAWGLVVHRHLVS
jgi:hypothetical protein